VSEATRPFTPTAQQRDLDLDWIKGLACIGMLLLHATIMAGLPPKHWLWTVQFEVIHQFYAWFFMASGMNVYRAAQRDMGKPWVRSVASYELVTLALFALGILYSINRRTLGHMELFQGVAACTAVTYLVARRRWPSWALIVISVLLFGATTHYAYMYYNFPIADRFIPPANQALKGIAVTVDLGQVQDITFVFTRKGFNTLINSLIAQFPMWERFLFVHFSLLPWVSWFLLGVVVMRWAGTKYEKLLWIMFVVFLAVSFLPKWYVPRTSLDFYLRGKVDFLFRSSAMAGLSILSARRWYKGIKPINKKIEFIGRESFLIFILQWFTVDVFGIPLIAAAEITGRKTWILFPLLQAATIFLTFRYTKYFAERRNRTIGDKNYLRNWLGLTVGFFVLALVFYNRAPAISYVLSFPVIIGVGMAFPAVRLVIRGALKPRKPVKQ